MLQWRWLVDRGRVLEGRHSQASSAGTEQHALAACSRVCTRKTILWVKSTPRTGHPELGGYRGPLFQESGLLPEGGRRNGGRFEV
eukprot:1908203-Rhodomonas_salina.3